MRYLNPIYGNANVAINTATAIPMQLTGSTTTDLELVTTVDAVVTIGLGLQGQAASVAPTAANTSAGANGAIAVGPHFLPAYVPRGFGVAAGAKISVKACTANGSLYVSEMG